MMRARWLVAFATLIAASFSHANMPLPQAPTVEGTAWILIDARTGTVLTEQGADRRVPPASLTKMMTTYVVDHALHDGRIHMGDMVTVSERAWRTGMKDGSRMFIQVGSQVSVEDLLRGVIIQSGNDASVALAERVAGSEEQFAGLMNSYAEKLGMKNTHFVDASGMPNPGHYSSARDLALLARGIVTEFPENYRIYAEKEFTYNNIKQGNRNLLLWRDPTVDGLKTGHTDEAGYCLVASAKRGDTRLISVVMGAKSEKARADESEKLLNWGFGSFETYSPYPAGTVLGEAPVWMGKDDKVTLGLGQDVALTIVRGTGDGLKGSITVQPEIRAPIHKGDRLGSFIIRHGDEVLVEQPLVAMNDVEQGNLFKRFWHWLKLLFRGLFG